MPAARKRLTKAEYKEAHLRKLAGEPNAALADYRCADERKEEPTSKGHFADARYLELLPRATEEE